VDSQILIRLELNSYCLASIFNVVTHLTGLDLDLLEVIYICQHIAMCINHTFIQTFLLLMYKKSYFFVGIFIPLPAISL